MAKQVPLTHDRLHLIERHWRKRRWIVLVGVLGVVVAGFGAVSYGMQWVANDRIAEEGVWLPATVYESAYGRSAKVHLEYEFEGRSYRDDIESGFFQRTNTTIGDDAVVIIDPDDPSFARTPGRRNISMMSRIAICVTPFALLAVWLGYGAFHIGGRFTSATWFRGEFQIERTGGSLLRATLWDDSDNVVYTQNKMQGRVRSGRPRLGCYFAQLGRFVMVVQDGDPEGVLIPCNGALRTEGLAHVMVSAVGRTDDDAM